MVDWADLIYDVIEVKNVSSLRLIKTCGAPHKAIRRTREAEKEMTRKGEIDDGRICPSLPRIDRLKSKIERMLWDGLLTYLLRSSLRVQGRAQRLWRAVAPTLLFLPSLSSLPTPERRCGSGTRTILWKIRKICLKVRPNFFGCFLSEYYLTSLLCKHQSDCWNLPVRPSSVQPTSQKIEFQTRSLEPRGAPGVWSGQPAWWKLRVEKSELHDSWMMELGTPTPPRIKMTLQSLQVSLQMTSQGHRSREIRGLLLPGTDTRMNWGCDWHVGTSLWDSGSWCFSSYLSCECTHMFSEVVWAV